MKKSNNPNEADLGRLLFGDRSPLSLNVCLKPFDKDAELLTTLDPFEIVSLGVGRRYYLARLNVGKSFATQFILLNIYNSETDENSVDELVMLERFQDDARIPFPGVIDFNSGYRAKGETSYSPTFYCGKRKHFFNPSCTVCSSVLQADANSDYLYCPRCEELNEKQNLYSFYECDDEQNVTLLEEVFAEYATTNAHSSNMPCSGCENTKTCFPEIAKTKNSVANEFHHIIPFSYEPYSVYGFAYSPLNLLDYSDLVSGRSKSDLLEKLIKSKENGRYRVLTESGSFIEKLKEQNYFTHRYPDLKSIFSIKLRVFMRVCDALNRLDKDMDLSGFSYASVSVNVSQVYAAGDSFTRASIEFLPPAKNQRNEALDVKQQLDEIQLKTIHTMLSEALFLMFFRNENQHELGVKNAVLHLIELINGSREMSVSILEELFQKDERLFPLRAEALRYYNAEVPAEGSTWINKILLAITKLGLFMSGKLEKTAFDTDLFNVYLNDARPVDSIQFVIGEVKKIFKLVDHLQVSKSLNSLVDGNEEESIKRTKNRAIDEAMVSDEQLLESALREILSDELWLDSVLGKQGGIQYRPGQTSTNSKDAGGITSHSLDDVTLSVESNGEDDRTRIMMPENLLDEKTVLAKPDASDDMEADDVMIMSSINRILRQL